MHPSSTPGRVQPRPTKAGTKVHDVPVEGGSLRVYQVGEGSRFVLSLHGLSDNHLSIVRIAEFLQAGYTFLAPDLRGRGDSSDLPGPYNLDTHAVDCIHILNALGIASTVVVGHSMGALIAERLALAAPNKVRGIVLIDGGIVPLFRFPAFHVWLQALSLRWIIKSRLISPEKIISKLVGPILDNLKRTFHTPNEYMDAWRNHPSFQRYWGKTLQERFAYDLAGQPLCFRSRVNFDAVRDDFLDALASIRKIESGLHRIQCALSLVRATRGMLDQPRPLIGEKDVADWIAIKPLLRSTTIPETSHTSILLEDRALLIIAMAIEAMF